MTTLAATCSQVADAAQNITICAVGVSSHETGEEAYIGGYLKSPLREALVGRVFCVVDMSQCSIRVFDRDSQYPTGISDAPFLLVLRMKRLSYVGAWIAADQGRG